MKPNFTDEQKNDMCYIIGDWYIQYKNILINDGKNTNNLENMSWGLVTRIELQYISGLLEITEEQLEFVIAEIQKWYEMNKNSIVVSYEDKTHLFGQKKEILKLMICDDLQEMADLFK